MPLQIYNIRLLCPQIFIVPPRFLCHLPLMILFMFSASIFNQYLLVNILFNKNNYFLFLKISTQLVCNVFIKCAVFTATNKFLILIIKFNSSSRSVKRNKFENKARINFRFLKLKIFFETERKMLFTCCTRTCVPKVEQPPLRSNRQCLCNRMLFESRACSSCE